MAKLFFTLWKSVFKRHWLVPTVVSDTCNFNISGV